MLRNESRNYQKPKHNSPTLSAQCKEYRMEINQYQTIFDCLSSNPKSILLTPNQRLSKHLKLEFQNYKQHQKSKKATISFYDKQITSIDSYFRICLSECQDIKPLQYSDYLLLDDFQEKLIWQQIIEKSEQGESLLFKQQCAQEAAQAWRLVHDWQLDTDNFEKQHYFESLDILAFKNWEKQFAKKCQQQKWLSQAQLCPFIIELFEKEIILKPDHLYFYGFDEINPVQKKFQNTLQKAQVKIENISLPEHRAPYQALLACKDLDEEIYTSATWAKQLSNNDTNASIAIIFPNLAKNRELILRGFIEQLCPEKLISGESSYPLPFNISSGNSLSQIPLVKSALSLLQLNRLYTGLQIMDFEQLCNVLLNGLIPETLWPLEERLKIESALRDLQQEKINLQQFQTLLRKNSVNSSAVHAISQFELHLKNASGKKNHSQWRELFFKQLKTFQWLADFDLDSESYQAMNKFKSCLNDLARLDNIESPCTLDDALEKIKNLVSQQLFQAESKEEDKKRIHILGTLEAAALDFSHIWVCQMDDETWPSRPKPNSFLPFVLQKNLGLPHSTAQREYHFCKNLTTRYQAHCDAIIFSFSLTEKDQLNNASPILEQIKKQNINDISTHFNIVVEEFQNYRFLKTISQNSISQSHFLEYFNDQKPLPLDVNEKIRGGQSILQNQANCPFRAYAQHRLKLSPLAEIKEGINAMDRGALIHELMEKIWRELSYSERLQQLTPFELEKQLSTHAESLYAKNLPEFPGKKIALKLEIERAKAIALTILEIEKQRPPFKIFALEKPQSINISGLKANIRIDRIDELADGSLLFIDYKSGHPHYNKWLTPRTEEPQLPLYLISNPSDKPGRAIAFVKLNHSNSGYSGVANSDDIAPGIINCTKENKNNPFAPDWESQIHLWQQDISTLAKEFLAGHVQVDPKKAPGTCEYCDFKKLCRIQEIVN